VWSGRIDLADYFKGQASFEKCLSGEGWIFISWSLVEVLLMMERLLMRRIDPASNGPYTKDIVSSAIFGDVKSAERCCDPENIHGEKGVGAKARWQAFRPNLAP
jgi:hypothetical protein